MDTQLDFGAVEERAKQMTEAELHYAMADCSRVATIWDEYDRLMQANVAGYYRDELSVYHQEMMRRGK